MVFNDIPVMLMKHMQMVGLPCADVGPVYGEGNIAGVCLPEEVA